MITDLKLSSRRTIKMKKSIKIIAVALVAIMLCGALVSCDLFGKKLNGTYENEDNNTTFEFDGKNVKVTAPKDLTSIFTGSKIVVEGTYEIDDDTITFEFVDDDGEELEDFRFNGSFDFEEKENGDIIIGNTEYEITD